MTALGGKDQLQLLDEFVHDPRSRIGTGWSELDELWRRGGFAPGELVLLAGRTGTRKTTVTMNLITNMLRNGTKVGLVGLDESKWSYIVKLASAHLGISPDDIERQWDENPLIKEKFLDLTEGNFSLYGGAMRPSFKQLDEWLMRSEVELGVQPEVVFIDYTSLLARNEYHGAENQRIHRLVEALQVWTNDNEVVVIALHQVGRTDEGIGLRYHGSTPLSLEGLKYGGEEIADVVLATYRPAKDPVGNMTWEMARLHKGDSFTYEMYQEAVQRVEKYKDYTFLQVLKNRPGTRTDYRGIPLVSVGESMEMKVGDEPEGFDLSGTTHPELLDDLRAFGGGDEQEALAAI